jgi:hypothetical protein
MSPEEGKNVDYNNVLQMNCGKADLEKNIKRYALGGGGPALCPLITKREQIHKHTASELARVFSSNGITEEARCFTCNFSSSLSPLLLALSTRISFVSRPRHNKNKT